MQIKLTLTIDIPDAEPATDAEIRQNVYEAVVQHASSTHLERVLENEILKSKTDDARSLSIITAAQEYHQQWHEALKNCGLSISVVRPLISTRTPRPLKRD